MVQGKVTEPVAVAPPGGVVAAVTVTLYVPGVVGEPVIRPEVLIIRPGGRPLSVKVKTAPGAVESVAWICNGGMLVLAM